MPVNTALALLPPTPTRLQYADSPSYPSSDSSFQATLRKASSPPENRNDDPSPPTAQDASAPASDRTDDTRKTITGSAGKASAKPKVKKAKADVDTVADTETHAATEDHASVAAAEVSADEDPAGKGKPKKDKAASDPKHDAAAPVVNLAVPTPAPSPQAVPTAAAEPVSETKPKQPSAKAQVKSVLPDEVKSSSASPDPARTDVPAADAATTTATPGAHAAAAGAATDGKSPTLKSVRKSGEKSANATTASSSTAKPSSTTAAAGVANAVNAMASAAAGVSTDGPAAVPTASARTSPLNAVAAGVAVPHAPGSPQARSAAAAEVDAGAKALAAPEAQFADTNHAHIVSSMHGQLLPGGGTMQIRLDPPELGVLQVSVQVKNGAMTATFETSNADATHQLSHSLTDLRAALESAGVTVDKIHVQQNSKPDAKGGDANQQGGQRDASQQNPQAKQDQQRRELLQRMWRKLSGGDPLDLTA